ncbi:hypothetical protein Y032_0010g1226 [Ancylostoma ceylanicum]|uniref:Uncharacterized protein n=1 Tax=Ancylostoma ceylanicum TaxID=53326 RepID=A0A016VH28_9BILA|nr:hypothetical protein Y032_0010g1226 [Ancylostoma ceylanicum]
MPLQYHKKAIIASSFTLVNLLKKYALYGEKLEYPQNEGERRNKLFENMNSLNSCLSQIKAGVKSLQSEVDNVENLYTEAKSKLEREQILLTMENLENEIRLYQTITDAELFCYTIQEQLAIAKIHAANLNPKISTPLGCLCSSPPTLSPSTTNEVSHEQMEENAENISEIKHDPSITNFNRNDLVETELSKIADAAGSDKLALTRPKSENTARVVIATHCSQRIMTTRGRTIRPPCCLKKSEVTPANYKVTSEGLLNTSKMSESKMRTHRCVWNSENKFKNRTCRDFFIQLLILPTTSSPPPHRLIVPPSPILRCHGATPAWIPTPPTYLNNASEDKKPSWLEYR